MRWKLLVIVSLVAAVLGFGLWCAMVISFLGTARELARHDWLFLLSLLLPLTAVVYSGVFAYRHTSRRRKTQALITVILTAFLIIGTYFVTSRIFVYTLSFRSLPIFTALT